MNISLALMTHEFCPGRRGSGSVRHGVSSHVKLRSVRANCKCIFFRCLGLQSFIVNEGGNGLGRVTIGKRLVSFILHCGSYHD